VPGRAVLLHDLGPDAATGGDGHSARLGPRAHCLRVNVAFRLASTRSGRGTGGSARCTRPTGSGSAGLLGSGDVGREYLFQIRGVLLIEIEGVPLAVVTEFDSAISFLPSMSSISWITVVRAMRAT
jgi:hypothetical protein